MQWPSLKEIPFVSGRVATEDDINRGAAVFLLQSEGVNIGTPIDIELPQYATHYDEESGVKTNVVLIQAEKADNYEYYGAYTFEDGGYLIGYSDEFTLLGNDISN
ncbi:hypothetical protein [Alteromonas mediterranea]|uniref:hypothetical protein n=1 Tax=Alteromonas mediterranea TaxID=314275 RepID=UPI0009BDBCC8|nr:hypothetical protein [Alteromonas mediterranea]